MTMEYLPRYAACRDIGHQWDYVNWHNGKRTLACYNCTTLRKDTIDGHGKISSRVYTYPNGYHHKRTPTLVRNLRRQLEKEARKLDRWVGEQQKLKLVYNRRA
jgi:hypothetical protein